MRDLSVYESGEGGEIILSTNDIEMTDSIYNQVYLAWFGGNISEQHEDPEEQQSAEQRFDYWQNNLFYKDEYEFHLNSRLEHAFSTTALSSQGLYELQQTALEDVEFLSSYGSLSVEMSVDNADRVSIILKIEQGENQSDILVKFVWDATKNEVINGQII